MSKEKVFTIKRGDTSPSIKYAPGVDLTGATVVFKMSSLDFTPKIAAGVVTVYNDAAEGDVMQYDWNAADTDTDGIHRAEYQVTYADGSIETFPNDGFITISIGVDL